jgi:hypothetical protein
VRFEGAGAPKSYRIMERRGSDAARTRRTGA